MRRRRTTPALVILVILAVLATQARPAAAANERPELPSSETDRKAYATEVCGAISSNASLHGIPEQFFARLIWRESLFDPGAVSPKGAQGIAQFMPATAKRRNLADPFDAKAALAASAAYLAALRTGFRNLGHAAAAYNAGEDRTRRWLAGKTGLPLETRDYVLAVTGYAAEEWKQEQSARTIAAIGTTGDFATQCQSLVMRELSPQMPPGERSDWKPWGIVLAGGFSEARAVIAFRTIRNRHAALIGAEKPLVIRKKNLSMGRRSVVRVMIGRDDRKSAIRLCQALIERGAACIVARN